MHENCGGEGQIQAALSYLINVDVLPPTKEGSKSLEGLKQRWVVREYFDDDDQQLAHGSIFGKFEERQRALASLHTGGVLVLSFDRKPLFGQIRSQ